MENTDKEEVNIFVDTNAFIHLRDLKDLPWRELFPKIRHLNIYVSSRVIEELDKFKVGSSKRKRDRSRKALKTIKDAARNQGKVKLRDKPIEIWLGLPNLPVADWSSYPSLDSSKPDDHLVLDTLSFGENAVMFSHDTGPLIRALQLGLDAVEPANSDWLLPAEPSKEDIEIKSLKKRLEVAQASHPKVTAAFGTKSNPIQNFELIVPILPPLETSLARKMAEAYLAVHPPHRIHVPHRPYGMLVGSIYSNEYTESDRKSYLDDYSRFQSSVHTFFEKLNERVHKISHAQPIPYYVENISPITASGLRVECTVKDCVYLASSDNDVENYFGKISFPKVPKKPEKGAMRNLHLHNHILAAKEPRDPTRFYWEKRPKFGDHKSALQCEDFRATEVWHDEAWVCAYSEIPLAGTIGIKISASNLREPLSLCSNFELSEVETTWQDDRVHSRLPKELSKIIRENS